jgi:hypothetical protein
VLPVPNRPAWRERLNRAAARRDCDLPRCHRSAASLVPTPAARSMPVDHLAERDDYITGLPLRERTSVPSSRTADRGTLIVAGNPPPLSKGGAGGGRAAFSTRSQLRAGKVRALLPVLRRTETRRQGECETRRNTTGGMAAIFSPCLFVSPHLVLNVSPLPTA